LFFLRVVAEVFRDYESRLPFGPGRADEGAGDGANGDAGDGADDLGVGAQGDDALEPEPPRHLRGARGGDDGDVLADRAEGRAVRVVVPPLGEEQDVARLREFGGERRFRGR
jgi:hypothetical protein